MNQLQQNFGVGGVLTGLPGSERQYRILSSQAGGVGGSFTRLPPARLVNDSDRPLFIEGFSYADYGSSASTSQSLITISGAGYKFTIDPARALGLMEFLDTPAMPATGWKLDKPFVLFPGESLDVSTDMAGEVIVSALGYYESNPAPQPFRYVPVALSTAVYAVDGTLEEFDADALRNDGEFPIFLTGMALDTADRAVDFIQPGWLKVRGNKFDWTRTLIHERCLGYGGMHTPLHGAELLPREGLTVQLYNGSGTDSTWYITFTGYKQIRMHAEHLPSPPPGAGQLFNWSA